jgi:hypothetical protein
MRPGRILLTAAALVPFALCAWAFWPTVSGGFLSDDYAVLAALSKWRAEGHLAGALLAKFHSGLDSPSFYYRPLSLASFGANFAMSGAQPMSWRLTNLALHLASGVWIFALVRRLSIGWGDVASYAGAAIGATAFLLFPTSPEAVAWVSGRYDLLALTFMLATLWLFLRSNRWYDGWGLAALVTAACALASKESAALLPPMIAAIAVARRAGRAHSAGRVVLFGGMRDAVPWILLGVAYFLLRTAIFGTPFQVYPETSPLKSLASGAWLHSMSAIGLWLEATLPSPLARAALTLAIAVLLVVGAVACWTQRASRWTWLAIALSAFASIALLLPHMNGLASNGEQGRLFYSTSALLALLVGLAIAAPASGTGRLSGRSLRMTASAAGLMLIVAEATLLHATIEPWTRAGEEARSLIAQLPGVADEVPGDSYAFVLVPDHLRSVPFGRNAQGGLMEPPAQQRSLSSRLIVQLPADLPAWPADARRGLVDALRRYPLPEVWRAVESGRVNGTALPTDYFCWAEASSSIVRLSLRASDANDDWLPAWSNTLAASPCAEAFAELQIVRAKASSSPLLAPRHEH